MQLFKNKPFARFARKAGLHDVDLCEAVDRINRGLIDADLGGGLIKQRIARLGAGRSGGFRTLIVCRMRERAFFVHGYAKNERDNIRDDELIALRKLAATLLADDDEALAASLASGTLIKVICDDQAIS